MTDHRTHIETFRRDGFVPVERFFDEQKLVAIESEIAKLAARSRSEFEAGHFFLARDSDVLQQIEHMQRYGDFFVELARDRVILDLVERIFNSDAVCDNVSYMAKPPRIGETVPYHQDNAYYGLVPDDALSVWLALDDATVENGCMRIVPGSHSDGLRPHGPTGVKGISYGLIDPVDPADEIPIELKRGDCSLHHCALFHSSHPNRSERSRRSVILFYHSSRSRVDQSLMEQYREVSREMIGGEERS